MARPHKATLVALAGLLLALGTALTGHGGYLGAKAALAQVLLDHAWERTLRDGAEHRPWPWADTHPVARLHVPSRAVRQVVLSGSSGRTLAFAPGHVAGTAPPGTRGLSMISGHRDTHFRFLEKLEPGDELHVERRGATRRYLVQRTAIVDLNDENLALDPTLDRLVLVTCYPFRQWVPGGAQRYVVVAGPAAGLKLPL